jgi:hypothetical protein
VASQILQRTIDQPTQNNQELPVGFYVEYSVKLQITGKGG